MKFPDDDTMHLLLAIQLRQPLIPVDGVLILVITGATDTRTVVDLGAELDALEERGWVTVQDPRPVLTEQGRYALERFLKVRFGARVVASQLRMDAA